MHLEYNKTFKRFSCTSFMTQYEMNEFSEKIIRWVENFLYYQAQRVVTTVQNPSVQHLLVGSNSRD